MVSPYHYMRWFQKRKIFVKFSPFLFLGTTAKVMTQKVNRVTAKPKIPSVMTTQMSRPNDVNKWGREGRVTRPIHMLSRSADQPISPAKIYMACSKNTQSFKSHKGCNTIE